MRVYMAGAPFKHWVPVLFEMANGDRENPPVRGSRLEYCGPWGDEQDLDDIARTEVVFAWCQVENFGTQICCELGAARATATPIWLYSPAPIPNIPQWLTHTFNLAEDAFEAFRDFEKRAPTLLGIGNRQLAACRDLTNWLKARGPKPEAITNGHIYLLQSGEFFKIGKSRELDRRMRDLKIQLPERAVLIHSFYADDVTAAEHWLHKMFQDNRLNGEWFRLKPEEVEFIREIQSWKSYSYCLPSKNNPTGVGYDFEPLLPRSLRRTRGR